MMAIHAALLAVAAGGTVHAQITSLDLAGYEHVATYPLDSIASEASGITYNPDTGTLFVVGDEGEAIGQFSLEGEFINGMFLSCFEDTEGLTYIGGGKFVIVEEREQDLFVLTYEAGAVVCRDDLCSISLGDNVGNIGIEGVSFNPITGGYCAVKEKDPQRVIAIEDVDFCNTTFTQFDKFSPEFGTSDISDIQVLATVPGLVGTVDQDNMLIHSQESSVLMEVAPDGSVLSTFDFSAIAGNAEGVTIDENGTIYVCGEDPAIYVLTAGCAADINGDGALNLLDFVAFQGFFQSNDPAADCDDNGAFTILDFVCFQGLFQAGCA